MLQVCVPEHEGRGHYLGSFINLCADDSRMTASCQARRRGYRTLATSSFFSPGLTKFLPVKEKALQGRHGQILFYPRCTWTRRSLLFVLC